MAIAHIAQETLQQNVEQFLTRVDRELQRPLLKRSFEACAKCASNSRASMTEFQQCLAAAREPVARAEAALNNEMNALQQRLQRCSLQCQDKLDDNLPAGRQPTKAEQEKLTAGLTKCVDACSQDGIKALGPVWDRLKAAK